MVEGVGLSAMKTYQLLAEPSRWTKGSYAKDAGGHEVPFYSPYACSWCISGALAHCYVYNEPAHESARRSLLELPEIKGLTLSEWNDSHLTSHADVLRVLTKVGL